LILLIGRELEHRAILIGPEGHEDLALDAERRAAPMILFDDLWKRKRERANIIERAGFG